MYIYTLYNTSDFSIVYIHCVAYIHAYKPDKHTIHCCSLPVIARDYLPKGSFTKCPNNFIYIRKQSN